ncbi:hypothetical protein Pmani_005252 [Petrolisthes manimaculis]|uniref:Uncharacterized protein n=1 Tax=Petrolisthes manimaculis TaxID=1843537 RepID=A0AAE1UGU2_9EUCA|nr:hypothetical protein Pmani_005252 [Petrolisthes manimaculis]
MSYDKSRKRNESKSDTAGEARGDDGKGRRDGVGGMESRERREAGRRGKGRQVVGLGWDDWKRKGGKAGGGERRGCLKEGGGRRGSQHNSTLVLPYGSVEISRKPATTTRT